MASGEAKKLAVVHNYGHGGSGITLHWGCAAHVVQLVKQHLDHKSSMPLTDSLPYAKL